MANRLYAKGKENFLKAAIDLTTATVKAMLLDSASYTPDFAADDALADVPGGARVSDGVALLSKSVTGGVFDAADALWTAVPAGTADRVLIYIDGATEADCLLIALLDSGSGLPFTTNGTDVALEWNNGANKIFAL